MKNIEINMSNLSQAQKKMCVQLIAHSNIKFEQKDNQYVAQIKVNPSNLSKIQGNTPNKEKLQNKKQPLAPLNPGKKYLARAVKIGDLRKLQQLHKHIEIYVYPKRLSLAILCELIENSYQKFWGEHKKRSNQLKSINFPEWFYKQMILSLRDKLKSQQLLVNLIDSLNHFMMKQPGLKIFYNFLSQSWPTDSLFYFLVLRGVLQQVIQFKILQKTNAGTSITKLKNNPYEKLVCDQEVKIFLSTLFNGGLSCSRSKPKSLDIVHQALTQKMFWEQSKRKNCIYFFDLLEHLVHQFMDHDVSSCDMSLSKTQFEEPSMSQLITEEHHDAESFKKQINDRSAPPEIYTLQLDPAQEERYQQRLRQQKQRKAGELLQSKVFAKINQIYDNLKIKPSQQTSQCLQNLLDSIKNLDKNKWIRYRGNISDSELYSFERVQAQYRQQSDSGIISNKLIKNILLIPVLRNHIVTDIDL